jgi:hypothetical protein
LPISLRIQSESAFSKIKVHCGRLPSTCKKNIGALRAPDIEFQLEQPSTAKNSHLKEKYPENKFSWSGQFYGLFTNGMV